MEEKDSVIELIFNDKKLKGVKATIGVLFSIMTYLIQMYVHDPAISVISLQLLIIFLFIYILAKFWLYKKKDNIWTITKYILGLMAIVLVLIYSGTMV